jgi:hypothetical protein
MAGHMRVIERFQKYKLQLSQHWSTYFLFILQWEKEDRNLNRCFARRVVFLPSKLQFSLLSYLSELGLKGNERSDRRAVGVAGRHRSFRTRLSQLSVLLAPGHVVVRAVICAKSPFAPKCQDTVYFRGRLLSSEAENDPEIPEGRK